MAFKIPDSYEVVEKHWMDEVGAEGCLLHHKKSGARVFLISNDDNNKVFNIAFRTPVFDSTGVAHIIEHTVLCGSDKYPAHDPFIELVKGSLNTFLNAMTYPDKTMYPVASTNDKDFFNLISVYMDAVFHPNITKTDKIFRQEGWHYEMDGLDGELICNGVVYNEMKGAFSSASDVLERYTQTALFPDTTYAYVSGGDPECIPSLTYEDYLAFYRRYYHPSNSYIYLYGDMDMEKILLWMDEEYLSGYNQIAVDSAVTLQSPFEKMAELTIPYSVTEADMEDAGNYYSWNKVIGTSLDKELSFAFQILEYVLLNAQGAPIHDALQKEGIGKDIYGGYEDGLYQPSFNITVKDAQEGQREQFVSIIENTLKTLVKDGINKRSLLAAVNGLEFRLKEGDYGRWPKGLMLGLSCFDSWLYDENDPFCYLEYQETIDKMRRKIDTDYFERLIETYLLNNSHGALVTAKPKSGLTEEREAEARKKLQEYKATLTLEEKQHIIDEAEALRIYQETPTPPEILEKIPMLEISDIRKEVLPLCNEERTLGDIKILFHPLFTSGIGYLETVFDADFVSTDEIAYLPLLSMLLRSLNTKNYTYQELADEINVYTGGISFGYVISEGKEGGKSPKVIFSARIKALYANLDKAAELAEEILLHTDFSDDKRIKDLLGEAQSRLREGLQQSGHITAVKRGKSYSSEAGYLIELTSGISYYHFIDDLYSNFDDRKEQMRNNLISLLSRMFTKEHFLASYTADENGYEALKKPLKNLWNCLFENAEDNRCETVREYPFTCKNEGFTCASQIQFVARTGNFEQAGLPFTGSLRVLQNILNYDYLWKNLREKGGAYGCMSGFSRNGDSYFVSYLDPHLKRTNDVYEGISDYVGSFSVSNRDMTKYIIGAISEMDIPQNPSARGTRGLHAYLFGIPFEQLQRERDEVLATTVEDIRALEPYMKAILEDKCLCAVGNEGKLKAGASLFKSLEQL